MALAIKPGQRALFIGDSITDCARMSSSVPHGDGYVRFVHEMIMARYPAHHVTVINRGVSGQTVRDLAERWTDDVIRARPDWLSIMIGINDTHGWLNQAAARAVSPEEYAERYQRIVEQAHSETDAQLVLMDPFYISTDTGTGTWRAKVLELLPSYINVVERLVRKFHARHIRTHALFQEALKYHSPDEFCSEPVHPYASGHMILAHGWLKSVGW